MILYRNLKSYIYLYINFLIIYCIFFIKLVKTLKNKPKEKILVIDIYYRKKGNNIYIRLRNKMIRILGNMHSLKNTLQINEICKFNPFFFKFRF